MKSTLIPIGLTCLCVSLARADFTPIPLDPTSFNQDPVIEKTAPNSLNDYVTVTPDTGTNRTGNTWYEIGYNTVNATSGFPAHASVLVKTNTSTLNVYTFQMPPDYHTNNCIFLGHHNNPNPNWWPIETGPSRLTLTTPARYTYISVLNASGNGACLIQYVIHYADGTSDSPATFSSTDWWSGNADSAITRMYDAQGLIGMGGGINNLSANHGVLWANDLPVGNPNANIASIDFQWLHGSTQGSSPWGNGRTVIFGLAGATDVNGVSYSPVAVSGYNQKAIIAADTPATWGSGNNAVAAVLTNGNTYCTVTMDGALAKTGSTWYEKGYYAAQPNTGIPAAGSTISSIGRPFIHYTMPSTYATNCAYYLSIAVSNATVKFATPTAASSLAFLAGGGNGGIWIRVELGFQGGGAETNWIFAPDWFTRDTQLPAYVSFGRMAPSVRAVNNTSDQFNNAFLPPNIIGIPSPQPFSRDPRNSNGSLNPNTPGVRLYDAVMPVASSAAISTITLVNTNTTGGNDAAIFAVSAGAGTPPIITTQPIGLVVDSATGTPIVTNGAAVFNDIRITKGYQGTNNISLITSNLLTTGVSYQWMKAPRGGSFRDLYDTFDMSTFVNVSGPNIGGMTSPILTISNATLADSGDYLVVASNQFGSQTSFVATVMVLTTNYSVIVGAGNGDSIQKWSADGTSGNGQETYTSANDQVLQKWLSTGLGGIGLDGVAVAQSTVPFVGPVGYVITPVTGASYVNSIRFYCANDSSGRDPRDYLLEGSNDGSTWAPIAGGNLLGTLMLPGNRNGTGSTQLNPMTQYLTEVDFANSISYKSYRLTITNCMEPVNTPLMQVAEIQLLGSFVPAPPLWVREPVPTATVFVGASPTFTASATGLGALKPSYQWYQSPSTLIAGATTTSYTITNVQLTASGSSYYCVAHNGSGTITSTSALLTVILPPTQSYPSAVLADRPMSYWRLDESPDNAAGNNGTLTHDYVGAHNGTYSNAVIAVAGYNPASDPNTAARFGDAATDSLVDNINDVDFARASGNATFSIEAWALGATPTVAAAIVTKGYNGILSVGTGTGTEQYAIDYTVGTGFRFLVRDFTGQGYQAQSTAIASDPTGNAAWHHLVGVCDQPNGNIYLYVDGLLAASGTIATNTGIEVQTLPTTIGSRKSTQAAEYDNQWAGTIDDVAIYPSVLTSNQVFAHFFAAQRPPIITIQPTNVTIAENIPVTFYSGAYGPGTIQYQWWRSDSINPVSQVAGQTASNMTFTTSTAQYGFLYQLVATSQFGSVTSTAAQLFVVGGAPSFIVDLPAAQTVYLGHIIQLGVTPGGTAPFTYQWQKNGVNISDDYRTSGSHSNILTIGYAASSDTASYTVIVTGQGSGTSTADALTVVTNTGSFFNATSVTSTWSLQGTTLPVLANNSVQLTAGLGSTDRAAFMTTKQNIAAFSIAFTYQDVSGAGGADGATFCIQNQAVTAAGGAGGGLGYSGITPSFALAFNLYASNTRGISFFQNGTVTTPFFSLLPNVGVGDNTNAILVNVNYDGTTLNAVFKDTVTGLSATTNYTVNLPSILGASTAWVGFTGGDGGVSSTQVMSWGNAAAVPIKLNAQKVGSNIVFSWPAQTGAYLLSSPTLGPTAVWSLSTAPWQLIGDPNTGKVQVTASPQAGENYFRLQLLP
jgi:hypothetical protein